MRILLSTLPELMLGAVTVTPPLGLEYIAGNVDKSNEIFMLEQLVVSYPYLVDDIAFKSKVFGFSLMNFKEVIEKLQPDMIAFSCVFSYQHQFLVQYLELIKQHFPLIITVAGGNHVTAYHLRNPKLKNLDYFVLIH